MGIRLQLLGVPKAEVKGRLSDLPLDKPASLLFYLAQRGDWISRAELAFLYRPDAPEEIALSNVRKFIHRVREFAWAEALEVEKFRVRYGAQTDVQQFREAVQRQEWGTALELYRGPFLEGLHLQDVEGYQTWLELEREELAQQWRTAVLGHARQLEASQPEHAEGWLERLLKADPLDEEALQAYLRILHLGGKRQRLGEVYEAFCQELKRELDVEPMATTRALFETLQRTEPQGKPQPEAEPTRSPRHNLPSQTSRFVGRKRELAQLSEFLSGPECRLLTLMGLGGMGKTRLGLELVGQRLEAFPDGVWFVPLVGVGSPELLVSSIASAIRFSFSGDQEPKLQLAHYLSEKRLLLLLDNFEHLVEGGILLEELLEAASQLRVVVTSRVALELKGERLFDLEGLTYPPAQTEEPLESFDSVRLFLSRAERLSSTFVAEGANLVAIGAMCRRVQGMPLAVELAATWTRSVSVPELLSSLEQGLDLLSTTQRDIPERHRNMQAVLNHSWTYLSPPEQTLLTRLSVFRGGITLEAAEQVVGAHLSLLLRLINQALLRRGPEGRYDMHELVRQYANGFLQLESGKEPEVRYCRYYLNLTAVQEAGIVGPEQLEVQHLLQTEIENLRQALRLALQHEVWSELEQCFVTLHNFFRNLAYFREGQTWFAEIVRKLETANLPTEQKSRMLAKARLRIGYFSRYLEPFPQVEALLQQVIQELRALGETEELALALQVLGGETRTAGNLSKAEPLILESCALSEGLPDRYIFSVSLLTLSQLQRDQGRLQQAIESAQQSLAIRRQLGDIRGEAIVNSQLANLARSMNDLTAARAHSLQALELKRQLGDLRQVSLELGNLGIYAFEAGNPQESEQLLLESVRIKEQLGEYYSLATTLSNLGEIYREQGRFAAAYQMLVRALKLAERFGSITQRVLVLVELAETSRQQGNLIEARTHLHQALQLAQQHDLPPRTVAQALFYLAQLSLQTSNPQTAYRLLQYLLALPGIMRSTQTAAEALSLQLSSKVSARQRAGLEQQAASLTLEDLLENPSMN